jgi:hypothetical protein
VGLGGLGEFFAWIERESPGEDAQRVVRIFLAEVGSEPWRAPSTPIPDLSAQPDYEVRTAELDLPGGSVVQVWYRHTYVTRLVEVIACRWPSRNAHWWPSTAQWRPARRVAPARSLCLRLTGADPKR